MDSGSKDLDYSKPGFPIRRSKDPLVCSSPWLIAAYHVLHRLLAPRHPPYTLSNLTALIQFPDSLKAPALARAGSSVNLKARLSHDSLNGTVQVNEIHLSFLHYTSVSCSSNLFLQQTDATLLSANLNIHSSIFKE